MSSPFLSVIVPIYNKELNLPLLLIDLDRHLSLQDFDYEIVLILKPHYKQAKATCDKFKTIIKNLKSIPLIENESKSQAIAIGINTTKANWRLLLDPDNCNPIIEFNKVINLIKSKNLIKPDIIIGSRFIPGAYVNPKPSFLKQLILTLGRYLRRLFLLTTIKDSKGAFKCFSSDSAEKIFSLTKNNTDLEILIIAKQLDLKVLEIPVFYSFSNSKNNSELDFFKNFKDFILLFIKANFTGYNLKK